MIRTHDSLSDIRAPRAKAYESSAGAAQKVGPCGKSPCCFSRVLAVRHALPHESCSVPFGHMLLPRLLCAFLLILLAQGRLAELRWRGCSGRGLSHCDASQNRRQGDKPRKNKH